MPMPMPCGEMQRARAMPAAWGPPCPPGLVVVVGGRARAVSRQCPSPAPSWDGSAVFAKS